MTAVTVACVVVLIVQLNFPGVAAGFGDAMFVVSARQDAVVTTEGIVQALWETQNND